MVAVFLMLVVGFCLLFFVLCFVVSFVVVFLYIS